MNRQPYATPPKWWPPKLALWWVRLSRGYRRRQLRRLQQIERVDVEQSEHLRAPVAARHGVLITPNHSAHYDSAALYLACDQLNVPLYFMTAWQVFAMSSPFEVWAMQRLGAFSIDRESTDRQAFKQAIEILQDKPHPLVIFPEGDIYHTTDVVTPFREGAAAIALGAAKRAERPVVAVPCGIKFFYEDDPTAKLLEVMAELEARVLLRPAVDKPLVERVYRLAEAVLALKELDFFGDTRSGPVKLRVAELTHATLLALETRHGLPARGSTPERAKALRQAIIKKLEGEETATPEQKQAWQQEMDDVFFVMQLYSYPGDYLSSAAPIERIAETIDKFEEDVLGRDLPRVRGKRRVVVRFGEAIPVAAGEGKKMSSAELTLQLQNRVQQLVTEIEKPR